MEVGGFHIFFEMLDRRGSGNGQDDWRMLEEPGERELAEGCAVFLRGVIEGSAWFGELAGGDGEPGDEGDGVLLAVLENVFVGAVGDVVLVLDADDVDDLAGVFDLGDFDFA